MINDFIIVGGGISGLYSALKLSDIYPRKKIIIFEKNGFLGGRIHTMNTNHNDIRYTYEAGAGRFSDNHKLLIDLIDRFGLSHNIIPISSERIPVVRGLTFSSRKDLYSKYSPNTNEVLDINYLIQLILTKSEDYDKIFLKKISIYDLSLMILSSEASEFLLDSFGYNAELLDTNAYDGVRMFNDGFSSKNKFFILKNGLSSLVKKIEQKLRERNITIVLNSELIDYSVGKTNILTLVFKEKNNEVIHKAKNVILSISKSYLLKLNVLKTIKKNINSVKGHSLNRIYAVYPIINNKVWFKDLPKITTNNPLQYIIPIDESKGLIMISYSDTLYADYWNQLNKSNRLNYYIKKNLNEIFPNISIPEPLFIKSYYWKNGAHFFKKGADSKIIYRKMLKPFNYNLFIIGECYSFKQAWIEGALETVEDFLKIM